MFIRKYVYQFFFFNGGAMGIFEKIVLRSRYKLYISENSIITSMHIKRIVKDIHVFASSFDITDIVENEKKIQSLVFVFFFYRLDLPVVAET